MCSVGVGWIAINESNQGGRCRHQTAIYISFVYFTELIHYSVEMSFNSILVRRHLTILRFVSKNYFCV